MMTPARLTASGRVFSRVCAAVFHSGPTGARMLRSYCSAVANPCGSVPTCSVAANFRSRRSEMTTVERPASARRCVVTPATAAASLLPSTMLLLALRAMPAAAAAAAASSSHNAFKGEQQQQQQEEEELPESLPEQYTRGFSRKVLQSNLGKAKSSFVHSLEALERDQLRAKHAQGE